MIERGYCLEINGELCPAWYHKSMKILREDAHALLPPYGSAVIRKVNIKITRQRKKKK